MKIEGPFLGGDSLLKGRDDGFKKNRPPQQKYTHTEIFDEEIPRKMMTR